MSPESAIQTVVAAWDTGVRYFDTAPWYGIGRSERRLGMGLSAINVPREAYCINTKVGRTLIPEQVRDASKKTLLPSGGVRTPRDPLSGFRTRFDYSGDGIRGQLRDSLQRLGTSYVDSLVVHDLDYGTHSAEEVEVALGELSDRGGGAALRQLRESGAVRAIGLGCNMTRDFEHGQGNIQSWESGKHEPLVERIAELVDLDFLVMAGGYTLLETRAKQRILPLCEQRNIGLVIATPYAGGFLVRGPAPGVGYMYAEPPPEITDKAKRMDAICQRHGVELAAAAIQFPLAHPQATCVIPGGSSPQEARENARHLTTPVPQDVWRLFKEEALLPGDVPTPQSVRVSNL